MLKNGLLCLPITKSVSRGYIMKKQKQDIIIILAVSLIFAVLAELCLFTVNRKTDFPNGSVSLLNKQDCNMQVFGYKADNGTFTQTSADPQLVFSNVNETVKTVYVQFGQRITKTSDIQVYYAKDNEEFTAESSTSPKALSIGTQSVVVNIPSGDYTSLRVDINGDYSLAEISVSSGDAKTKVYFDGGFSIVHVLIMFAAVSIVLFIFVKWLKGEKTKKSLTAFELVFLIGCFVFYTLWIFKKYNYAPDEAMRYDVSYFFFKNNRLPVGREAANPIWGFSYALLPTMLCNVLDYIPMKLAALFTSNEYFILLAARMVSVCCATVTVYFLIKTSKQIFTTCARWIMIVLVAAMPQFAFLASYINNDICALLGISMILYAWTLAINEKWNFKNALLLSVGMAICATSYYNSYMWVLASIFIYFTTYFYQNKKDFKGFVRMSAFIVVITLVLMGYLFIRHIYLYNDLIGIKVSREYGELYGAENYKPSGRGTPQQQGYSLIHMLIGMEWLSITYKSFIGMFGYMEFQLDHHIYKFYAVFFAIAIIGVIVTAIKILANMKNKKPTLPQVTFTLALIACGVVTVCLSIYNSYCTDFQPQGRYCYPMFPALAVFTAKGFETLIGFIKNDKSRTAAVSAICTVLVAVSVNSYYSVLLLS